MRIMNQEIKIPETQTQESRVHIFAMNHSFLIAKIKKRSKILI
jgi:hypothetical protein